jgi:predicted O-methyltransferase YrrM
MQVLTQLAGAEPFDFILIDGDKGRYHEYFAHADRLLRRGGLIVVDDVFFHGDALNAQPETDKGMGAKRLLELVRNKTEYRTVALPVANGILLAQKL